jgi:small-conductance mechanosensitive channel
MVHTIPFGDMGTVTNFSRDYIITKLDIRVRYDADIKRIKKIVKKINKKIRQDEELSQGLLKDIKSQGVRQMDDSAMILRVKFKTIPGEQFVLRREVYRMIQDQFKANNIEFAHRNVTVYLPPETGQAASSNEPNKDEGKNGAPDSEWIEKAAAAAAIAVTQDEDDAKKLDDR